MLIWEFIVVATAEFDVNLDAAVAVAVFVAAVVVRDDCSLAAALSGVFSERCVVLDPFL